MKRAAIGLIAGLIACPWAFAQSAWDLVFREQLDWTNREHRLILARDLAHRVSLLEAILPEMSERDLDKLNSLEARIERFGDDASSSERGKLFLSKQYQHRALLQHTEQMQQQLDCVQSSTDLDHEIICWGRVGVLLLDGDRIGVALETLRDYRVVPRSREMPVKAQHPALWYAEFGRGIVEYLLVPYLENQSGGDESTQP